MLKKGYWVNPMGVITKINYHPIKTIVDNPSFFGFTEDKMIYIYKKYSDVNEWEGVATETIIDDLLEKGWLYCYRKKGNTGKWVVKLYKLDKKTRLNVQIWAKYILKSELATNDELVKMFRSYKNSTNQRYFEQIVEGDFFD